MARCIMVFRSGGRYHRIPETEIENWEEVFEAVEGEPELIERLTGWEPYTHAFRLPDGSIYMVAFQVTELLQRRARVSLLVQVQRAVEEVADGIEDHYTCGILFDIVPDVHDARGQALQVTLVGV